MIRHTLQSVLSDYRVGLVLRISGFGELGGVAALLSDLATTIPSCNCYGFPIQWRTLLVTPGGSGMVYSATSFVLDAIFFAAVGRLTLLPLTFYRRRRASLPGFPVSQPIVIALCVVAVGVTLAIIDSWSFYSLHLLPSLGP